MKIKFLSINFSLLLIFSAASGQDVIYNLNECIRIGLERNFSLLIARNSETIAKNNYTIGNAGFLPTLDLTGRHNGSVNDIERNFSGWNSDNFRQ